jgi:hypothetical protein
MTHERKYETGSPVRETASSSPWSAVSVSREDTMTKQEQAEIGYTLVSDLRLLELRKYWKKAEPCLADIEKSLRAIIERHYPTFYESEK